LIVWLIHAFFSSLTNPEMDK